MTSRLLLLTLFLLFTLPVFSQEWFQGIYYQPLPVPELDTLSASDLVTSRLVSYDVSTRLEQISSETGKPPAVQGRTTPGSAGLLTTGEEPVVLDRNFGNLSLAGNTSSYPNSTAVKMYMTFPNGLNYVASGVMIDSRFVLTAGHCIHNKSFGGWADHITVAPGYDAGSQPFGTANGTQFFSFTNWTVDQDFNWDIGFIKLDRYVGALSGWLGYGYSGSTSVIADNTWHNFSYPAESPFSGEEMYYRYGTFDEIGSRVAYYKRPGFGGQSGSGLYYKDAANNRYVYMVHSHTQNNAKSGCVRLFADLFDNIQDEKKKAWPNSANISPLWVQCSNKSLIAGCQKINSVRFLVHNYSEASINKTVSFRVYLSDNANISTNDRLLKKLNIAVNLSPRSSLWATIPDVAIPANVHEGSYFIGILIDLDDGFKSDNNTEGIDSYPVSILPARALTLSPITDSLPSDAGCLKVQLESNTNWGIQSGLPWVSHIVPSSGFGDAQVEICYDANTGVRDRKGVLVVSGDCVPNKPITLVQNFSGIHVFPNPTMDQLHITYTISKSSDVYIRLYAADGKEIKTLVNERQQAGDYELDDAVADLPAGLYIMSVKTDNRVFSQKVLKL